MRSRPAELLKRFGRYNEALDSFNQVLAVWAEYPKARNSKAALLVLMHRLDDAAQLLPNAPPQTQEDWIASQIRGMILMRAGKVAEAIQHFRRGSIEAPFARVRRFFGNALASERIRSGNFREAAVILQAFTDDTQNQSVSNVLLFHAVAAERMPSSRSLFDRLRNERTPIIVNLRDEIAARYGVVNLAPRHDLEWITDHQFEAVLLEAA